MHFYNLILKSWEKAHEIDNKSDGSRTSGLKMVLCVVLVAALSCCSVSTKGIDENKLENLIGNGELQFADFESAEYIACDDSIVRPDPQNPGQYLKCANGILEDQGQNAINSDIHYLESEQQYHFDCIMNGTYKDTNNCNKYIKCWTNGTTIVETCPDDKHWSVPLQRCMPPCEAFCDSNIACDCHWPTCPPTPKTQSDILCREDGVYPDFRNCSKFVHCSNGIPFYEECSRGQHFNSVTNRCDAPCKARCDKTMACECGWKSCSNSSCYLPPLRGSCSKNLFVRWYYDKRTSQCTQFQYGGCQGNENNFASRADCEQSCGTPEDTSSTISIKHPNSMETADNQKVHKCTERDGVFPFPDGICYQYIKCTDGQPTVDRCPAEQGFDSRTNKCVWWKDSDCNRSQGEQNEEEDEEWLEQFESDQIEEERKFVEAMMEEVPMYHFDE